MQIKDAWTLGALDGASVQLEMWRRTLRACGCDDDESAARLAAQTFGRLTRETYAPIDDVPGFLTFAKRTGVKVALVTNGASDSQREKLRALDLESRLDAVVISGEVGVAKPDPAIFELALARIGVPREGVWHVGDSLTADVAGAQAAGLTAVMAQSTRTHPHRASPRTGAGDSYVVGTGRSASAVTRRLELEVAVPVQLAQRRRHVLAERVGPHDEPAEPVARWNERRGLLGGHPPVLRVFGRSR